jgi:hypothetical protein
MKRCSTWFTTRNSVFTELQWKLPCSQKTSRNSCHHSKISNPKLPSQFINTDFCIFFKPVWSSTVSTMTRIYTGRSDFKSSQEQKNYLFSKTSRPAPAPTQHPTPAFFSGSKVASAESLTTHIRLEPSLKISGATPPFNLSASVAHIGTTLFYLNHLPIYLSLNRSHPFWSY